MIVFGVLIGVSFDGGGVRVVIWCFFYDVFLAVGEGWFWFWFFGLVWERLDLIAWCEGYGGDLEREEEEDYGGDFLHVWVWDFDIIAGWRGRGYATAVIL